MLTTSLSPRLCFDICICRLWGLRVLLTMYRYVGWLVAIVVAPIQREKSPKSSFSLEMMMMMVRCETIGKKQKQKQPNGWLFNRVGTDRALLRLRQRVTTGAVEPDSKARRA